MLASRRFLHDCDGYLSIVLVDYRNGNAPWAAETGVALVAAAALIRSRGGSTDRRGPALEL